MVKSATASNWVECVRPAVDERHMKFGPQSVNMTSGEPVRCRTVRRAFLAVGTKRECVTKTRGRLYSPINVRPMLRWLIINTRLRRAFMDEAGKTVDEDGARMQ
jgi:hypothetical protein